MRDLAGSSEFTARTLVVATAKGMVPRPGSPRSPAARMAQLVPMEPSTWAWQQSRQPTNFSTARTRKARIYYKKHNFGHIPVSSWMLPTDVRCDVVECARLLAIWPALQM